MPGLLTRSDFFLLAKYSTDFYSGEPLRLLTLLANSDSVSHQSSAALTFAEITERDPRPVSTAVLAPIVRLLSSTDVQVQIFSAGALGNLAVNVENKSQIVEFGCLEPLSRLMFSSNIEVQTNVVGCITNLTTFEPNKTLIANSKILPSLIRLSKSRDIRVQRNASGAILNLTHNDENRKKLVSNGAIPILVKLLNVLDMDVQYYSTTALSNIAVDEQNRVLLSRTEPKFVGSLLKLLQSPSSKVKCQSVLALRNLASDEYFQLKIVEENGLQPLLELISSIPLLQSPVKYQRLSPNHNIKSNITLIEISDEKSVSFSQASITLITGAVACLRNISIHTQNESAILKQGAIEILAKLLRTEIDFNTMAEEEILSHTVNTIRNLFTSYNTNPQTSVKSNKKTVEINTETLAGAQHFPGAHVMLESIKHLLGRYLTRNETTLPINSSTFKETIKKPSSSLISETTACLAVLALHQDFVIKIVKNGICDQILMLALQMELVHTEVNETIMEIVGNSGAILGNILSRCGKIDEVKDWFLQNWNGVDEYFSMFLNVTVKGALGKQISGQKIENEIFGKIVGWSLIQILEDGDETLMSNIAKMRSLGPLEFILKNQRNMDFSNEIVYLAQFVVDK
ncbi:Vacuolar protein 8, partial [Nowakowskiella sp. JEL0078]